MRHKKGKESHSGESKFQIWHSQRLENVIEDIKAQFLNKFKIFFKRNSRIGSGSCFYRLTQQISTLNSANLYVDRCTCSKY